MSSKLETIREVPVGDHFLRLKTAADVYVSSTNDLRRRFQFSSEWQSRFNEKIFTSGLVVLHRSSGRNDIAETGNLFILSLAREKPLPKSAS